jgi:hypothetical protein
MKKKFKKPKIELNVNYRLIQNNKEVGIVKILLLDGDKRVVFSDGSKESESLYSLKGELKKI